MIRHWTHTRTYKMHGQITTVKRIKMYDIFLIDTGGMILRRLRDFYEMVFYDSKGLGLTHRYLTRIEFIRQMKFALGRLKRIKNNP